MQDIDISPDGRWILFATNDDLHPMTDRFACGMTMSPDGKLVACNITDTLIDGEDTSLTCFPSRHKGFIVGDFLEKDTAPHLNTYLSYLTSPHTRTSNWCPNEYRLSPLGNYILFRDLEFHNWFWRNHMDYIVGLQRGRQSALKGLWVVQWKTNTWTLVTHDDLETDHPVLWISEDTKPQRIERRGRGMPQGSADDGIRVYSLDGRLLYRGRFSQLTDRP